MLAFKYLQYLPNEALVEKKGLTDSKYDQLFLSRQVALLEYFQ